MQELRKIAIVGAGHAGSFFANVFDSHSYEISLFARKPISPARDIKQLFAGIENFEAVLLCVSDDAIAKVSAQLKPSKAVVIHCSGAIDINEIDAKHNRRGVLYPLMSLKNPEAITISSIPFCLESNKEDSMTLMVDLVKSAGAPWFPVDSAERSHLHLAAVLVHNFTNHLYHLAQEGLNEVGLDFKILMPLIESSVAKLHFHNAKELQTGPALRHDESTIKKHLSSIKRPLTTDIYKLLTQSIQQTHDKKL